MAKKPPRGTFKILGRQNETLSLVDLEGFNKEAEVVSGATVGWKIDYDKEFFFTDTLTTLLDTYGTEEDMILALENWLQYQDNDPHIEYMTSAAHTMALIYTKMLR